MSNHKQPNHSTLAQWRNGAMAQIPSSRVILNLVIIELSSPYHRPNLAPSFTYTLPILLTIGNYCALCSRNEYPMTSLWLTCTNRHTKQPITIPTWTKTNRLPTQLSIRINWHTQLALAAKRCQNELLPTVSIWHRWATQPTRACFRPAPSASSASFIAYRSRRAIISSPCATISSHQGKKKQGFRLVFLSLCLAYSPAIPSLTSSLS